jgi:hypothetical protein
MCPSCWTHIDRITDEQESFYDYVKIDESREKFIDTGFKCIVNGFAVSFKWDFDHPVGLSIVHVAIFDFQQPKDTGYGYIYNATIKVKDIVLGMFATHIYSAWVPTGKWRKSRSAAYFFNMYELRDKNQIDYGTKKEYLSDVIGIVPIKSSQLTIAKNHILSPLQIRRMIAFDLNDYNDVKKCNYRPDSYGLGRIEYNDITQLKTCCDLHMNRFDMLYLRKNKIGIEDYTDYLYQCHKLGIKNKHPQDFKTEHEKMSRILLEIEEKEKEELVRNSKKILKEFTAALPEYKSSQLTIKPVKSATELKRNAEYMHNCIYGYLEKYLNHECILYIVREKSKIVANVELKGSSIIQIRARFNEDPPARIAKAVKKMVASNKSALENAIESRN